MTDRGELGAGALDELGRPDDDAPGRPGRAMGTPPDTDRAATPTPTAGRAA